MTAKDPRAHRYEDIKARIKEDFRDMPPHTRIPSRVDMIKRYGVTRTTIEKAISELTGSGHLYSVNGSGTYIAESGPDAASASTQESDPIASAKLQTWGVLLPSITEDLYPEIVRGIEDTAQRHHIHMILCNTDNDPDKQHDYIERLAKAGVQGVIAVPAIANAPAAADFRLLKDKDIPLVLCNRTVDGIDAPKVLSNNFYGAFLATRHLLALGHRRMGYIAAPRYSVAEQRYQGCVAALHEAGLAPDAAHAVMLDDADQRRAGRTAADRLLALDEPPSAVLCFNDAMAEGLYETAAARGIAIGRELAVVGYGNTRACERLPVKLTSVTYRTYETGSSAAELLLRMMRGERLGGELSVVLQPALAVRESCGAARREPTGPAGAAQG